MREEALQFIAADVARGEAASAVDAAQTALERADNELELAQLAANEAATALVLAADVALPAMVTLSDYDGARLIIAGYRAASLATTSEFAEMVQDALDARTTT